MMLNFIYRNGAIFRIRFHLIDQLRGVNQNNT